MNTNNNYLLKKYGHNTTVVSKKINYRNIIETMLKKYGCLSMDLVKRYLKLAADKDNFLSGTNTQVEIQSNAVVSSITSLCSLSKCRLENDVLIHVTRKDKNPAMMDCLWVALDFFRIQMNDLAFAQDDLFIAEEPCMLCRVTDNGPISFIEVDETSFPLLLMLQNNYLLIDKKVENKDINLGGYIIVVREESHIQRIKELNLQMPYKIALLKQGDTRFGTPHSITYPELDG